jgi:hypothetical protein
MKWRYASNMQYEIDYSVGRFLYVPLRIFCCLGSRLKGAHCHNLMHFVNKLMHTLPRTQN